jgi:hypothetical protein
MSYVEIKDLADVMSTYDVGKTVVNAIAQKKYGLAKKLWQETGVGLAWMDLWSRLEGLARVGDLKEYDKKEIWDLVGEQKSRVMDLNGLVIDKMFDSEEESKNMNWMVACIEKKEGQSKIELAAKQRYKDWMQGRFEKESEFERAMFLSNRMSVECVFGVLQVHAYEAFCKCLAGQSGKRATRGYEQWRNEVATMLIQIWNGRMGKETWANKLEIKVMMEQLESKSLGGQASAQEKSRKMVL